MIEGEGRVSDVSTETPSCNFKHMFFTPDTCECFVTCWKVEACLKWFPWFPISWRVKAGKGSLLASQEGAECSQLALSLTCWVHGHFKESLCGLTVELALTDPELPAWVRLALSSDCLCLPNAGITGYTRSTSLYASLRTCTFWCLLSTRRSETKQPVISACLPMCCQQQLIKDMHLISKS